MKERAERLTEVATKEILQIISNRKESIGEIINVMTETHTGCELAQNPCYCALVSTLNNLEIILKDISYWLNRKNKVIGK